VQIERSEEKEEIVSLGPISWPLALMTIELNANFRHARSWNCDAYVGTPSSSTTVTNGQILFPGHQSCCGKNDASKHTNCFVV